MVRLLENEIRACTRCPELVRCRQQAVPGEGRVPALFLIVGMAPGRLGADRTGHPFVGDQSSRRLRILLEELDLLPWIYLTNAAKCAPTTYAGRLPGSVPLDALRGVRNRDPSRAELENCRPFLAEELHLVKPRVALALGRVAERALADALGRPYRLGTLGELQGDAPATVFLPHPASWGYRPQVRAEVAAALRALRDFVGLRGHGSA